MTRKRFIKLIMGRYGFSRNIALFYAETMRHIYSSYEEYMGVFIKYCKNDSKCPLLRAPTIFDQLIYASIVSNHGDKLPCLKSSIQVDVPISYNLNQSVKRGTDCDILFGNIS